MTKNLFVDITGKILFGLPLITGYQIHPKGHRKPWLDHFVRRPCTDDLPKHRRREVDLGRNTEVVGMSG